MVMFSSAGRFYTDLSNLAIRVPCCLSPAFQHQHNAWVLAQPMRLWDTTVRLTPLGNINWMMAREADLSHPVWANRIDALLPTVHIDNRLSHA